MTAKRRLRPLQRAQPPKPASTCGPHSSASSGAEARQTSRISAIGEPEQSFAELADLSAGCLRGPVILVEDGMPGEGEFDSRTVLYQLAFLARPDLGLCRRSIPTVTPVESVQCGRCGGLYDPNSTRGATVIAPPLCSPDGSARLDKRRS
jgi:hypothetical protein